MFSKSVFFVIVKLPIKYFQVNKRINLYSKFINYYSQDNVYVYNFVINLRCESTKF
jgi:hypothetical protein